MYVDHALVNWYSCRHLCKCGWENETVWWRCMLLHGNDWMFGGRRM